MTPVQMNPAFAKPTGGNYDSDALRIKPNDTIKNNVPPSMDFTDRFKGVDKTQDEDYEPSLTASSF